MLLMLLIQDINSQSRSVHEDEMNFRVSDIVKQRARRTGDLE